MRNNKIYAALKSLGSSEVSVGETECGYEAEGAMPKLRSSQKSKVPLPSTPQRVQTDVTASQPPTPMEDQSSSRNSVVSNVQHV